MKKFCSILGMIGGIAVIALGVLLLLGEIGGYVTHAGSAPALYDSGYASFGADFYSYVSNNAAEAAAAGRAAAANAGELVELVQTIGGIFLTAFGLFMFCTFGAKLGEGKDTAVKKEEEAKGYSSEALPEI